MGEPTLLSYNKWGALVKSGILVLYTDRGKKTEANILDSILQKRLIYMYKLQYSHEQFSMSFQ